MSEIRTARKDRESFGVKVKKGQRYVDKGFGQIEPIEEKKSNDDFRPNPVELIHHNMKKMIRQKKVNERSKSNQSEIKYFL